MPLRPLTVGELLDAAVGLLRENAKTLLAVALVLAAVEQVALYPLRDLAAVRPPTYFPPYTDHLAEYWLMIGAGYATEVGIIALLGGLAAQAAAASITGQARTPRAMLSPGGSRLAVVAIISVLVGLLGGLGALACWVPWIFTYGLLGLAVPAAIIDGKGPLGAIGRSVVLSSRVGLRACWIRLIGYLSWLAIRMGLGFGGLAALAFFGVPYTTRWVTVTGIAVWTVVNTVAYATLACLDSVLHLETRMRTEGLDISATLARRNNRPIRLAVS
ncbi:MAG: hypothetical protein HKP61_04090 [Dactylosporangium sp.]|nr:hypothetical protein [Dactylosporangium sp.]NNJ60132.1 hypothetical protein [Dactylosporangium sp.]